MKLSFPSHIYVKLRSQQRMVPYTAIRWFILTSLSLFLFVYLLSTTKDIQPPIETVSAETTTEKIIETTTTPNYLEIPYVAATSAAAEKLPRNGSLFCWVLTSPKYFETRVPAVNETWLKRCDHGQFFTTEPIADETIPFTTVFTGLNDSYHQLFYKTMRGFHYPYVHISKKFDWYMKADDDSFVIVEHLREYLEQFNASEPYYFGYRFKPFIKNGYNSGGAGYALSRGAVKLFVEKLYHNRSLCPYDENEDLGIGRCLASLGVYPADTRNSNKQHRFLPYSLQKHFSTTKDDEIYTVWPEKRKYDVYAPELITMHHQTPEEIRMIETLLYRVNDPRISKYHSKRKRKR